MLEKVLLVDDELSVLNAYSRSLRGSCQLFTATSANDALETIRKHGEFAVVVSDMRMPRMSGLELLSAIQKSAPNTVRVMLTGDRDQQTTASAVNDGSVYKFLNKPCEKSELTRVICSAIERYRTKKSERMLIDKSLQRVASLEATLKHQSECDALTGFPVRVAFENALLRMLAAEPSADGHVLCSLDIDRMHVVNDAGGYEAGDAYLLFFSRLVRCVCRPGDLFSRISANRFVVVFKNTSVPESEAVVNRLFQMLMEQPFEWEGLRFTLSASVGLVQIREGDSNTSSLLSRGELAGIVAKEKGGGQCYVAGSGDDELDSLRERVSWLCRIHHALKEDRFRLYRQDIVPVEVDASYGEHFEVLVRMLDEEGGIIAPQAFLAAAAHFGIASLIDRWVISNTLKWMALNPQWLANIEVVSINLSGHSVGDPQMRDFILTECDAYRIPAEKICFEITETVAIRNLDDALEFMNALRARGIRFALDDFGTGFSSYGYLKDLPVDYLKIDGQFIREIDSEPVLRAMVKSISEIARAMGKKTIAEYVQNEDVLEILDELGIHYAQGFLLGRPEPL